MVDRVSSRVGMVLVSVPRSDSRTLQGLLQNPSSVSPIDVSFIFDSRKQYEFGDTRFNRGVLYAIADGGTGCRSNKQGVINGNSRAANVHSSIGALPASSFRAFSVNDASELTSLHNSYIIRFRLGVIANTTSSDLPQPPMPSWQSACIRNPIPIEQLREFLAQDVEQNLPVPEERSTLSQAVAHRVTHQQQTDRSHP